jgi:hypothetical protein
METAMKPQKSASTKPTINNAPTCPKCGQSLNSIHYAEYGTKKWINKGWQESKASDAEWHTGCCDVELDSDELQELGVF